MSDLKKGDEESGHHRIRITLTSRNKDEVEKGAFRFRPFPPRARFPRLRLPCCPAPALFLFVLAWFDLSHLCSICLFDCRRQEAVAAHQGPRPHAHQASKVDCQEVSLRKRAWLA